MTVTATQARPVLAADVMSAPTVTVPPTASVWTAWSVMMHSGLRHLVVAVGDACVGVVDDRSVFAEWPMGPLAMRRRTIGTLVRTSTTCVQPDTALGVVAQAMVAGAVDAVPVVDGEGRLVGILTAGDLVRAVAGCGLQMEVGS